MAIPNGYTLVEIGKTYTNVDYYIDTSVAPIIFNGITGLPDDFIDLSLNGDNSNEVFRLYFSSDSGMNYIVNYTAGYTTIYGVDSWYNISDGKIKGVDTISLVYTYIENNSNAVESVIYNDWLYVKETTAVEPEPEPEPEPTVTIKLTPLYKDSEIQEVKAVNITESGILNISSDDNFVAMKSVVVNANIEPVVEGYVLVENEDDSIIELIWAEDVESEVELTMSFDNAAAKAKEYIENTTV